jgi:hypothetical protein
MERIDQLARYLLEYQTVEDIRTAWADCVTSPSVQPKTGRCFALKVGAALVDAERMLFR